MAGGIASDDKSRGIQLADLSKIETYPRLEGRQMVMVLTTK